MANQANGMPHYNQGAGKPPDWTVDYMNHPIYLSPKLRQEAHASIKEVELYYDRFLSEGGQFANTAVEGAFNRVMIVRDHLGPFLRLYKKLAGPLVAGNGSRERITCWKYDLNCSVERLEDALISEGIVLDDATAMVFRYTDGVLVNLYTAVSSATFRNEVHGAFIDVYLKLLKLKANYDYLASKVDEWNELRRELNLPELS